MRRGGAACARQHRHARGSRVLDGSLGGAQARPDGLIGYTQPDEPDGLGLDPSGLSDIEEPGWVTFLTLTQHFAPGTGEFPWQYPGYYEGLAQKADVLGVDFYPLQSLCSPEKLALNHDVQVELVKLAEGSRRSSGSRQPR